MLRSMTGYGAGKFEDNELAVRVEIKSVNHRYCDVSVRIGNAYAALEERVRRKVKNRVQRGRLEIFVGLEEFATKGRTVNVDSGLVKGYWQAFERIGELIQSEHRPSLDRLLQMEGIFSVEEADVDVDVVWKGTEKALDQAVDALVAMRQNEGQALQQDILHKLDHLDGLRDRLADRAPQIVAEYHLRLTDRISKLLNDVPVDEDRLVTEVAIFADRCDINEELVRLQSHSQRFRETCRSDEAVGRKLDFLIQEMNREVNTIGSKASDPEIARVVVDAKAELEKVREQVQNVE